MSATNRAVVGGCALGLATGWNIANTGAVAQQLADVYGVGLATIGLFTTALFVMHLVMQIPGGRASDRFGPRRVGLLGLVLCAAFSALALAAHITVLALVARGLTGIGTGLSFIAGSAYVRAQGGTPFAQGLFGGVALAGGGFALAVVPWLESSVGWRAPYLSAAVIALGGLLLLAAGPVDLSRQLPTAEQRVARRGVVRDRQLYPLAALYGASLGLSIVIGNWVVTLLHRHGGLDKGTASAIGALTLVLGIVTRPLGGWILHVHPARSRLAVGASLLAGALGTLLLVVASPAVAAVGAVLVGLAAGIPFAPAFTGAALTRPDAQAAAVGFVNGAASVVVLVGTPLVGLSFSLPGGGRTGFAVIAALWVAAFLVLPSSTRLGASATPAPEPRAG
jgi:MFS transporter, NNP family, nitrate/nitrite transporter